MCSQQSLGNKIVTARFRGGDQLCKLGSASQLRSRGIVLQTRVGTKVPVDQGVVMSALEVRTRRLVDMPSTILHPSLCQSAARRIGALDALDFHLLPKHNPR